MQLSATEILSIVHFLMAVLAVWRITELLTQDRITAKLRAKFPTYLWQCPRCMSVWAGIWATVMFAVFPWANWPFALAWIYLAHEDWSYGRRVAREGRKFTVTLRANGAYEMRNELSPQELQQVMTQPQIFNQIFNPGGNVPPLPAPEPQPKSSS